VTLTALMERSSGSPDVKLGLIDGPVVTEHPDLTGEHLHEIPGNNRATCTRANSTACLHGTFIAGILCPKRDSPAPAICPNCTLLIRPIFAENTTGREQMPSATPLDLAAAIIDCIDDGITSLGAEGLSSTLGGTSVAVPFVTGAIALLWSEFPAASAAQIKLAISQMPNMWRC
jgi:subtilisin family serine protease